MSTATHPSAPTLWERRGTALGIPAVVIMAASFAFAGNGRETSAPHPARRRNFIPLAILFHWQFYSVMILST